MIIFPWIWNVLASWVKNIIQRHHGAKSWKYKGKMITFTKYSLQINSYHWCHQPVYQLELKVHWNSTDLASRSTWLLYALYMWFTCKKRCNLDCVVRLPSWLFLPCSVDSLVLQKVRVIIEKACFYFLMYFLGRVFLAEYSRWLDWTARFISSKVIN